MPPATGSGSAALEIRSVRGSTPLDLYICRLDGARIAIASLRHAARQRVELHRLEEADQLRAVLHFENEVVQAKLQRHIGAQPDQFARKPRLVGIFQNRLPPLFLLDLVRTVQKRVEIAVFLKKLCCSLRTDAGNTGDIVDRIAGHRLQVDHLFGQHAPFLDHVRNADLLVLHAVVHVDVRRDELHQILVRGDDRDVSADRFRLPGIGGDDIVSLEALRLDAGQVEGARRLADQAELGYQLIGRRGAVRLVGIEHILAEGLRGIIEDNREMRRRDPDRRIARIGQQLPQHVAEAGDGADRQAVGFARQGRQGMKRPEDESRAVNKEKMIAFFHGCMDSVAARRNPYKVRRAREFMASPNCYQFVIGGSAGFP